MTANAACTGQATHSIIENQTAAESQSI